MSKSAFRSLYEVDEDLKVCPVGSCGRRHAPHLLMCGYHWRKVPPELQRQVYRAWNNGAPRSGYLELAARAIETARAA